LYLGRHADPVARRLLDSPYFGLVHAFEEVALYLNPTVNVVATTPEVNEFAQSCIQGL
jgi:hypothetical protein